jgi:hypothetical protein
VGVDTLADNAVTTSKILDGTILNADISGSAGIVDSKLATISTAGKVSGAALTGLSSIPAGAGVIPTANVPSTVAGSDTQIQFNDSSTLAGTATFTWNKTLGSLSNTSQPAFLVYPASTQSDIAIGGVTIIFGTEVFDQGSDFASNTFTAPVTGKYQFSAVIYTNNLDTAAVNGLNLVTSNRTYNLFQSFVQFAADVSTWTFTISILADMDSGDTAYLQFYQDQGTAQSDIQTNSCFSGALLF